MPDPSSPVAAFSLQLPLLWFTAGDEATFVFVGFAMESDSNRAIDEHRLARRQEHLRGAC
jgi:hypothetical protein